MKINLDIQDQNLTPEAREILISLLHRLEKEPEKFTNVESSVERIAESEKPIDVAAFLEKARVDRKPLNPITPEQFFSRIMKTKGFENAEEAHQHIQDLRAEWD